MSYDGMTMSEGNQRLSQYSQSTSLLGKWFLIYLVAMKKSMEEEVHSPFFPIFRTSGCQLLDDNAMKE